MGEEDALFVVGVAQTGFVRGGLRDALVGVGEAFGHVVEAVDEVVEGGFALLRLPTPGCVG